MEQEDLFALLSSMKVRVGIVFGMHGVGKSGCSRLLADGTSIAVKKDSPTFNDGNNELIREVVILSELDHPNLVKLIGFWLNGNESMLIYEYMENTPLNDVGESAWTMDWASTKQILVGIAKGLYMNHTRSGMILRKEWHYNVLARIRSNAFRIELAIGSYEDLLSSAAASVEAEAAVGNVVYMLPSFYNHDCDPNTHIIWADNADAKLKALQDIKTDEELRICYIDASMDRDARQNLLFQGFGFKRNCARCLSGD